MKACGSEDLPREDETIKSIVGSEGVAIEVTQPECPLRVAVKVSWRLEEEVSITLVAIPRTLVN